MSNHWQQKNFLVEIELVEMNGSLAVCVTIMVIRSNLIIFSGCLITTCQIAETRPQPKN